MRLLSWIGGLAIIAGLAVAAFFFGGFFNIAATYPDPAPVLSALTRVRNMSIARQSSGLKPPALDDAAVQGGARAFAQFGCANCHGAPGGTWAKFSEGLNPDPPDLKDTAKARPVEEIFWVVKNGIRMTGMPSFAKAGATDAQIWQIAAFVKKLPSVADADYKTWTAAPAQ